MGRPWSVGFVLCLSAGLVMILAAFLPWGSTLTPPRGYTAIQLHFYEPFVVAVILGGSLAFAGWWRRRWAAAIAMTAAMGAGIVMLMIHGDLYGRLTAVGAHLGADLGHPYGFGMAVFLADGFLAFAAAIAVSIEASPPVVTGEATGRGVAEDV